MLKINENVFILIRVLFTFSLMTKSSYEIRLCSNKRFENGLTSSAFFAPAPAASVDLASVEPPARKAAVEDGRPPQRLNAMSGRDLKQRHKKIISDPPAIFKKKVPLQM